MAGSPAADWSDWVVNVHDARGRRVLVRAFTKSDVAG
ncbi:protein of unknown function [Methylorubrum extorquens DM4]|uniref:Uncharacterized protein n=1 Tax=Methylorubrum extorquens (strain DSM 6343 / CIP 106787 / DM4) TaxID=661410 RepID=C7C7P4_METED|nr:protein of unknown function [Methylorubrum extorquens DM4]